MDIPSMTGRVSKPRCSLIKSVSANTTREEMKNFYSGFVLGRLGIPEINLKLV